MTRVRPWPGCARLLRYAGAALQMHLMCFKNRAVAPMLWYALPPDEWDQHRSVSLGSKVQNYEEDGFVRNAQLTRLLVGARHRVLIPQAVILGAITLIMAIS